MKNLFKKQKAEFLIFALHFFVFAFAFLIQAESKQIKIVFLISLMYYLTFLLTKTYSLHDDDEALLEAKRIQIDKTRIYAGIFVMVVSILIINNVIEKDKIFQLNIISLFLFSGNYQALNHNKNQVMNVQMEDDEIQSKTNRLVSRMMVLGAFIFYLSVILTKQNDYYTFYFIGFIIIISLVFPYLYSKWLHQKKYN